MSKETTGPGVAEHAQFLALAARAGSPGSSMMAARGVTMFYLRFADYTMPDPESEALGEAMWTARYDLARLTQTQAYLLLSAAEAYCHFTAHPASTKSIVAQLREVRTRVRLIRRGVLP